MANISKDFLPVLVENYQAQIAGFYNDDKTDEERKIRMAVILEYEDLIAIYKDRHKKWRIELRNKATVKLNNPHK